MPTPSKPVIEKYRRNNKDKIKRRNKVTNARASGKKKRGKCSSCGKASAEAHHGKGGKVTNLCKTCHEKRHGFQG